ncbi:hypothetical protein MMC26_006983 [Xylographa opegraphella]|nr:hypothetical protein [Xylographa opegraphella]
MSSQSVTPHSTSNHDPGFDVHKVLDKGLELAAHSWEWGTAAEALLEFHNPELSVFSKDPFPGDELLKVDVEKIPSLVYARKFISTEGEGLCEGDGSTSDPSSLGPSALLLSYLPACNRQVRALLQHTPRLPSGAISHRATTAELWSDFVYMAPPFLAHHAVATADPSLLHDAIQQCLLYGTALERNAPDTPFHGLWAHILAPSAGPEDQDPALWLTGNAWAAMGMARVLAVVRKWGPSRAWQTWQTTLEERIMAILRGAVAAQTKAGFRPAAPRAGLLRNYLDVEHASGDAAGTALLAAAVYRMAVLAPERVGAGLVERADVWREAVSGCVKAEDGLVVPVANIVVWQERDVFWRGSSEGQSFVVMMVAAWRDYLVWKGGVGEGK